VLTGSPGLGQTRHEVAPDGAACKGDRMDWGAWATQTAPRSSRQSAAGCCHGRLSLTRRLHPMSRLSEPLRTTPRTQHCQLPDEKGSDPFSKGLTPSTPPLRTSTSTQENGSRCAAQRLGGRLAVSRREETCRAGPDREHVRRVPCSGDSVPALLRVTYSTGPGGGRSRCSMRSPVVPCAAE
jgi:hypothetical protein